MAKSLDQVVSKWTTNAGGAQQAFTDGVQGTTVDVVGRAIANQAGLLANFTQAVNSGFWAQQLSKVGTNGWKSQTVAKAGNYGTGISAGATKYQTAMQTWLPRIQQAGAAAKAMPGTTLDQRLARSAYVARTLYNAKRGL